MKTKKSKRVMAVVMAVLLTVGIMPMDWAVTKAAASTVHSFDATAQASVGDDKAVIAEGTTFNDGYFKIVGKVTQRTNSDGSIKAYELASKAAGAVQFTTESTSSVVVGLSSTGGSNESAVALINTADNSVNRPTCGSTRPTVRACSPSAGDSRSPFPRQRVAACGCGTLRTRPISGSPPSRRCRRRFRIPASIRRSPPLRNLPARSGVRRCPTRFASRVGLPERN